MSTTKLSQPGGLPPFTPLNPAGLTSEDLGAQLQVLKEATDSLAQRYDNPNWFNVAAGFFKPQLGGFGASLGSAAQALGENVEQQRANILPVAQMRAELGRLGATQKQKVDADTLIADFIKKNPDDPVPSNLIAEAERRDPGGPAAASAKAKNAEITRLAAQIGTTISNKKEQAGALMAYTPELYQAIPVDATNPGAALPNLEKKRQDLVTIAKNIPGTDPNAVNLMSLEELQDKVYKNERRNEDKIFEDKDVAKQVVANANSNLDALAEARTIVDKPAIAKLLGTTQGVGALSAVLEYIKSSTPDNGLKLNKAIAQISTSDPTVIDDFQVLTKVMMRNVAATRAAMQNPSVSSTDLASLTNPSPSNTAPAIRKIYDLMAHEESTRGRTAQFTLGYTGKPQEIHRNDDWRDLNQQLTLERRRIASDSSKPGVPDYYSLYSRPGQVVPEAPVAAPLAGATPAAAPATTRPAAPRFPRVSTQSLMNQSLQ